MPTVRSTLCLATLFFGLIVGSGAQEQSGTVSVPAAPVLLLPDPNRTPLAILKEGQPLKIIAREGDWYRVVFRDARLGNRTGYIRVNEVTLAEALPANRATVQSTASGTLLDDAAVEGAIRASQSKRPSELAIYCIAGAGVGEGLGATMARGVQPTGGYNVIVSLAEGRIAFAAAEAKRLSKPFAAADVPAAMRDTTKVFVVASPQTPQIQDNAYEVAAPLERIVLKSKTDPSVVLEPEKLEIGSAEWTNPKGGKARGTTGSAVFPVAAIRALPPGDFDVVLVTKTGDRLCKVSAKDRLTFFR